MRVLTAWESVGLLPRAGSNALSPQRQQRQALSYAVRVWCLLRLRPLGNCSKKPSRPKRFAMAFHRALVLLCSRRRSRLSGRRFHKCAWPVLLRASRLQQVCFHRSLSPSERLQRVRFHRRFLPADGFSVNASTARIVPAPRTDRHGLG